MYTNYRNFSFSLCQNQAVCIWIKSVRPNFLTLSVYLLLFLCVLYMFFVPFAMFFLLFLVLNFFCMLFLVVFRMVVLLLFLISCELMTLNVCLRCFFELIGQTEQQKKSRKTTKSKRKTNKNKILWRFVKFEMFRHIFVFLCILNDNFWRNSGAQTVQYHQYSRLYSNYEYQFGI